MPTRSIEVELKYEIINKAVVEQFLQKLTLHHEKRILDVYLDTPEGNLFKKGIFVRLRDSKKLDIKFNKEDIAKDLSQKIDHTHCDEVSLTLPLDATSLVGLNDTLTELGLNPIHIPSLEELKAHNNLIEAMTIDKRRRSYEGGGFHIDIDDVVNLGEFLEIEKMTDEHSDQAAILDDMRHYVRDLGLRYIDTGYNELYWRKHNFDLYLQGKYLLTEDRQKYRPESVRA